MCDPILVQVMRSRRLNGLRYRVKKTRVAISYITSHIMKSRFKYDLRLM